MPTVEAEAEEKYIEKKCVYEKKKRLYDINVLFDMTTEDIVHQNVFPPYLLATYEIVLDPAHTSMLSLQQNSAKVSLYV